MWNTGCRMIGNGLTVPINIVDGEDLHFAITVPPGGAADFNDVIFPWCKNGKEIREKAFRVSNVLTGASMPFMYLFQDYQINMIGFTLFSDDDSDLWGLGKTIDDGVMSTNHLGPMPSIDIFVMPNKVFGLPATTNNMVFLQVLGYAIGILGAAGSIAQAAAAAGGGSGAAGSAAAGASALTSDPTRVPSHRPVKVVRKRSGLRHLKKSGTGRK